MTTARKYLNILKEREPQRWKEPLTESALTEQDLSVIEEGLGYTLPVPYREFLLSYQMPEDLTVLVTFSREENDYVPLTEDEIGPTVEFEWHNIKGNTGQEFLENLKKEQSTPDGCPCFLEAGFLQLGNVYGYLT